jgi:hypothetical protein
MKQSTTKLLKLAADLTEEARSVGWLADWMDTLGGATAAGYAVNIEASVHNASGRDNRRFSVGKDTIRKHLLAAEEELAGMALEAAAAAVKEAQ